MSSERIVPKAGVAPAGISSAARFRERCSSFRAAILSRKEKKEKQMKKFLIGLSPVIIF